MSGFLAEEQWPIILVDKLFLDSPHTEGITLGVDEEVYKVAGGASGMGVDRIGEVDDRANEEQNAGVHWTGFRAGSLASVGTWDGTGIKVSSDKELTEVGRIAEGDGGEGGCEWRGQFFC